MGDGHQGITNAGATFLPDSKRIQCYFHVKKNFIGKKGLLPTPAVDWPLVNQQIWLLHQAPTQRMFEVASELLIAEWRAKKFTDYADYFEKSCLRDGVSW